MVLFDTISMSIYIYIYLYILCIYPHSERSYLHLDSIGPVRHSVKQQTGWHCASLIMNFFLLEFTIGNTD